MCADHLVRPRRMWSGVGIALVGAALLAVFTATWQPIVGIVGAVLLVAGGLTAVLGGALFDTHDGSRPLSAEVDDLRAANSHSGTRAGDMITDPRIRAHAALASRRSSAVRRTSQRRARPALQPLGAWLLLGGALALILAQGSYAHTQVGQHDATRSLLLAVIVGLAGLRIMLARRPGRFPSGVALVAGLLLIAFAVFTDHDRQALVDLELVVGSCIVLAALLSLDRPREYQGAVPPPGPVADAVTVGREPGEAQRPGRRRLRTAYVLGLLVVASARSLRRRRSRRRNGGTLEGPAVLRYRVPVGQDPAAVISTLRQAGYDVAREQAPTRIQEIVVTDPTGAGLDRSAVRATIARAPIDLGGAPAPAHRVVFTDEPEPAPPSV